MSTLVYPHLFLISDNLASSFPENNDKCFSSNLGILQTPNNNEATEDKELLKH